MNGERYKDLLVIAFPILAVAILSAAGVSLTLAGVIVAGAAFVALAVGAMRRMNVISGDMYWAAIVAGWGILFILSGLMIKGVIPVPLSITGDPLLDVIIISTVTSVIMVTVSFFLPKLYSRFTRAKAVAPIDTPYLEE
ncbi:MAG: hypothetical protein QXZ31_08335 [Thermofilaceae archaeon]